MGIRDSTAGLLDWSGSALPKSSRRVLVTGGAGYIGSAFVRTLLERGYWVRVLDSLLYGDESIANLAGHARFDLVVDDFRREIAVEAAMSEVEAVVHLGAIVGDPACALDEDLAVQTNLGATHLLVRAAKAAGVPRFLFASTCSVYGASDGELNEGSTLNPVSLYANTKVHAEEVILASADSGFAPVVLRFATVYGVSYRPRFDLVINLLTAKAVIDGRITIYGGDQWRPFVHVQDVVDALVLALEAPAEAVASEIFNVGSTDENYRLGRVGEIIAEIVFSAQVVTNAQIIDPRNYYVNADKLRDRLGFRPRQTVQAGVEEVRDFVVSGRIGDYRDPRFSNHRSLTEAPSAAR